MCVDKCEIHLNNIECFFIFIGFHDEGQFIKSMFLLCFWDIIYGNYPPDVLFIRKYQDCPLDWRTQHFYDIREKYIKVKLIAIFIFWLILSYYLHVLKIVETDNRIAKYEC